MDMEIVYYEQYDGVLQKVAELVVQTRNASLDTICREALGERLAVPEGHPETQLKCYTSLFEGKEGESVEVDLTREPNDVDCIIEALKNDRKPILYLFREPSPEDIGDTEESPFSRKGSGMVREFLSRTPRHSRMTPPLTEGPALQQNGTVTKHRAMQKKHNSESDMKKSSVVCRQSSTPMTNKPEDHLLEKIASELYQGQESPLQLGDTRGLCESIEEDPLPVTNGVTTHNGDGSDVVSPTSAPWRLTSRSSYEELLTILETPGQEKHHLLSTTPQFRPKLETMAAHSESLPDKPGFLTVRPRPKNPPLSRDLHFKDFSRMSESYGYEGPPSPLMDTFNLLVVEDGSGVGGRGEEGEGAERRGSGSKGPRKWTRKTAIRRQRRKVGGSISEPPPDTSYSYRIDYVQVSSDSQTVHKIYCREYHTIGELKEAVVKTLNRQREQDEKWKVSDLVLLYPFDEQEYELYNDYQFLYSTALYQSWAKEESTYSPANTVLKVRSAGRTGEKDKKIMQRLSHLTGLTLDDHTSSHGGTESASFLWRIADGDKKEVQWARRLLHTYVMSEVAARNDENYCLSMELVSRQTSTILALKIPLDNKVEITFHYQQAFSLVKRVNVHRLAVSVLEELYQCVVACGLIDQEKCQTSEFVLQVSGERSYIAGQNELLQFKDIRQCIIKGEPIHLSITQRPKTDEDIPFRMHVVPIDAHSGTPPLHNDIAALSHKECDSQALSIWDVNDELSIQVVRLDLLPVRSLPNKTPVVVEAALYHGATQLCDSCCTSQYPVNGLLRMKELMTFKITKKDVPKSAKLMFTVREPPSRKESTVGTRKATGGRFLYWGLVSITDHQNMLRMGEVQVALWKGYKKDGEDFFEPNPCAPAYNNPDPKAVVLTIKFNSYSFPVYYPCTTRQSWSNLLGLDEGNAALRKQFQRLLDLIKEGKLHSVSGCDVDV